jgi:hypothetical protein
MAAAGNCPVGAEKVDCGGGVIGFNTTVEVGGVAFASPNGCHVTPLSVLRQIPLVVEVASNVEEPAVMSRTSWMPGTCEFEYLRTQLVPLNR